MMGTCSSSPIITKQTDQGCRVVVKSPLAAKVIHLDGKLQEFRRPIKAAEILSQNPNCFLCSSETMYVNSLVPQVAKDEDLQLGHLYFLFPFSRLHRPLSLQDLCALAVKACAALDRSSSSDPSVTKTAETKLASLDDSRSFGLLLDSQSAHVWPTKTREVLN